MKKKLRELLLSNPKCIIWCCHPSYFGGKNSYNTLHEATNLITGIANYLITFEQDTDLK